MEGGLPLIPGNHTLSEQALAWVIDAVQPGAKIVSADRLQGGVSSHVHGITLLAEGKEKYCGEKFAGLSL